ASTLRKWLPHSASGFHTPQVVSNIEKKYDLTIEEHIDSTLYTSGVDIQAPTETFSTTGQRWLCVLAKRTRIP
ncbi:hypothetical protein LSAT2_024206, partial [Lamellibrachia satsuma]